MHASKSKALPLRFEAAEPEVRTATIERVLAGLRATEQAFLIAHPQDLGLRCEALIIGESPEWFEGNGFLDLDDLRLLSELVVHAIPKRLRLRAV